MHNTIQPKVTLVGAGPGDPDLLTLKGAKALAEANVVLYDALANEELLSYAPKNALKIFVGKRKGSHAYTQEEINQLIVDNALTYGHVVRLKGGVVEKREVKPTFQFQNGAIKRWYAWHQAETSEARFNSKMVRLKALCLVA